MVAVYREIAAKRIRLAGEKYSVQTLTLLFFAFSMAGWLWEVVLHIIFDGELVNRGALLGPWLPIYGAGGIAVVVLLRRLADRPQLLFAASALLCGAIEYGTSVYLEAVYGLRWWDYSTYTFNIGGRICLETMLLFGVGCCVAVYAAAPALAARIGRLPRLGRGILCAVLVVLFAFDFVWSTAHPNVGPGVTERAGVQQVRLFDHAQITGLARTF